MAYDIFLQLDGIECESSDEKHQNWLEVQTFHFGVVQPSEGPASGSGAGGYGRAHFDDLQIAKHLSKSTPAIHKAAAAGTNIANGTLHVCRATGEKQVVLEVKLKNVMISVVSNSIATTSDLVDENISLKYGQISVTYTEIDHSSGASKGNTSYGWDLTTNQPAS